MHRLLTLLSSHAATPAAGIFTTANNGAARFKAKTDGGQYNVDWGDGVNDNHNSDAFANHTYSTGATKTIKVTAVNGGNNITDIVMQNFGLNPVMPITADVSQLKQLLTLDLLSQGGTHHLTGAVDLRGLSHLTYCNVGGNLSCSGTLFDSTNIALSQLSETQSGVGVPRDYSVLPALTGFQISYTNVPSITFGPSNSTVLTLDINNTTLLTSITGLSNLTNLTESSVTASALTSLSLSAANMTSFDAEGGVLASLILTGYRGNDPEMDFPATTLVQSENLNAAALNALFTSLGTITNGQTIDVTGNPGAATCNPTIATAKGWIVVTA